MGVGWHGVDLCAYYARTVRRVGPARRDLKVKLAPKARKASKGRKATLAEVETLFKAISASDKDPFAQIAELGLLLCAEETSII